ncbi:hypothetical protein D3C75_927100 [compost metagenome]
MIHHHLVQCRPVCWVEPFGYTRVGVVDGAAQCDKEGASGDCAPDGAALVDGYWGEPVYRMAAANWAAICGVHRHGGATGLGLIRAWHLCCDGRQGQRCWARMAAA